MRSICAILPTQHRTRPWEWAAAVPIATNLVTTSIHVSSITNASANWEGHVAWNDNSTRYEGSGLIEGTALKIGTLQGDTTMDDIFVDAVAGPLTLAANVKFAYNQ